MYKNAALIWIRAILLNAVFVAVWTAHYTGALMFFVLPIVFGIGCFITWPLIFPVAWLVKKYVYMPYEAIDKFYWLLFMVTLLGLLSMLLLYFLLNIPFGRMDNDAVMLLVSVGLSAILGVVFTRSSLTCLNTFYHEKSMV